MLNINHDDLSWSCEVGLQVDVLVRKQCTKQARWADIHLEHCKKNYMKLMTTYYIDFQF